MLTLAYGRTSQRITCPHRDEAVPTNAVNITIADSGGSELLASTPATKGSFTSTVAAAASAGARSITVADAAGLSVDEPIVLTDSRAKTELAVVEGFEVTTDTIHLRDPLVRPYAIGNAAKSALITYTANLSNTTTYPIGIYYVALFACADWTASRPVVFRIVQHPLEDLPIQYAHIRDVLSHVGVLRDSYDDPQLDEARRLAWAFIEAELLAHGRDPKTLRDPERIAQAGGYLAAALFCQGRGLYEQADRLAGNPPGSGVTFRLFIDRVCDIPAWYDRDQDLIRDSGEMKRGTRSLRRGL